jgi:hypothetical protein
MRGESLASEPAFELRWLRADGGEQGASHKIVETGNRGANRRMPRLAFAPDGDHLWYFEEAAEEKTAFVRVTLDGREKVTLFTNEDAEEIVPSPDGKWIAFKEQHQIYVAPLPDAIGRPLVIGRNGAPVPVRKLTEIGGSWPLLVAGREERRLAARGPKLSLQEVARLFVPPPAAAPGAPAPVERRPAPDGDDAGRRDAQRLPADRHRHRRRRIITMKGDEVIEDGTLLVDGTAS